MGRQTAESYHIGDAIRLTRSGHTGPEQGIVTSIVSNCLCIRWSDGRETLVPARLFTTSAT